MSRVVVVDCHRCDGEGVVPDPLSDGFVDIVCPCCEGEGWMEVEEHVEEDVERLQETPGLYEHSGMDTRRDVGGRPVCCQ